MLGVNKVMSITHTTAARLKWVKNRKYHISCIFLCDQIHSFIRTETFSFFCATKSTTPPLCLSSNVGVGPERKLPHLLQIAAGGIGNLLPGEVSSFRNISKNFQNTSNIQNIINSQIYTACMEYFDKTSPQAKRHQPSLLITPITSLFQLL